MDRYGVLRKGHEFIADADTKAAKQARGPRRRDDMVRTYDDCLWRGGSIKIRAEVFDLDADTANANFLTKTIQRFRGDLVWN